MHEPYSSALKKQNTAFTNFPSFPSGRCPTISFPFLHKPRTYTPHFLVLFQLIKFDQFLVSKCFCIHDILSQMNQYQSLPLLWLVFLNFVSALLNPSLFVKRFLFLSFLSCFWSCFFSALILCKLGFYFLFRNNISFKTAKQRIVQVVNTTKSGSLVWQLPILLAINCLCLSLVKQKIQGVLKTLRNFLVDIDHKERAGWIVFYLKNRWKM